MCVVWYKQSGWFILRIVFILVGVLHPFSGLIFSITCLSRAGTVESWLSHGCGTVESWLSHGCGTVESWLSHGCGTVESWLSHGCGTVDVGLSRVGLLHRCQCVPDHAVCTQTHD